MAFQAVAYAVSGRRLVVDMLGHLTPGCGYTLLKEWRSTLSSEPLRVPDGFILVAYDNKQRLLRNYLARGANCSRLDVLTNMACVVIDGNSSVENHPPLHPDAWSTVKADDLANACDAVNDLLREDN